jgi:hypothetical protein
MTQSTRLWDDEVETLKAVLIERLPRVPTDRAAADAVACAEAIKAAFIELAKPTQA